MWKVYGTQREEEQKKKVQSIGAKSSKGKGIRKLPSNSFNEAGILTGSFWPLEI